MMFDDLEASSFIYSSSFYQNEFEDILRGIIVCSNCITSSGVTIPNDENEIRDLILKDYLKVQDFKEKHFNLANYHFDRETMENTGRADIRVLPVKDNYINDDAYYIIECKRLDNQNLTGISGLNAEYIKNGICRFVTDYYSSYFGVNGMIGFVVEELDIEANRKHINTLLYNDYINAQEKQVNANTVQEITPIQLSENFNYSYTSTHQVNEQKQIVLYHLMLDFSKNIEI